MNSLFSSINIDINIVQLILNSYCANVDLGRVKEIIISMMVIGFGLEYVELYFGYSEAECLQKFEFLETL